jgi:hypothetical protein
MKMPPKINEDRMRTFAKMLALATLAMTFAAPAKADLVGTHVTGSLKFDGNTKNYFDPTNGFVPTGYLNKTGGTTVTVSATSVEFGFKDGSNTDTADFTGNTLSIKDISTGGSSSFVMTFTDAAFSGLKLAKVSDTFDDGLTASLVGTTLTLTSRRTEECGTYTARFTLSSLSTAAVPEPSQLALAGVAGLFSAGAWLRRRRAV